MKGRKGKKINITFYDKLYFAAFKLSVGNYSPEINAVAILSIIQFLFLLNLNILFFLFLNWIDPLYSNEIWSGYRKIIGFSILGITYLLLIINNVIFFNRGSLVIEHFKSHQIQNRSAMIFLITLIRTFFLSLILFITL